MFKLPMDIQIRIFEYDPTYRNIFSSVLKEFHKVHSFWYLRFHDVDLSKEMSTSKDLTYNQAFNLAYYWNFDFRKEEYTMSYDTYYSETKKGICDIHSRADFEPIKNYFPILKANLSSIKFLLKKNVSL
jgi:hypothetical protein